MTSQNLFDISLQKTELWESREESQRTETGKCREHLQETSLGETTVLSQEMLLCRELSPPAYGETTVLGLPEERSLFGTGQLPKEGNFFGTGLLFEEKDLVERGEFRERAAEKTRESACESFRESVSENFRECEKEGETTVLEQAMEERQPLGRGANQISPEPSNYRVATNRAWWKMLLLGIVTLGLYPACCLCSMVSDLNIIASRYDGKKTISWLEAGVLTILTCGIYGFHYQHRLAERIGAELNRRELPYQLSAADFWCWQVLGGFLFIGTIVYNHKLCRAMNLLGKDYNSRGW